MDGDDDDDRARRGVAAREYASMSDKELDEEIERRRQAREEVEQATNRNYRPEPRTSSPPPRRTAAGDEAIRRAYAALEVPGRLGAGDGQAIVPAAHAQVPPGPQRRLDGEAAGGDRSLAAADRSLQDARTAPAPLKALPGPQPASRRRAEDGRMTRHAWWPASVALVGLAERRAARPDPSPRDPPTTGCHGAGSIGGSDVRVVAPRRGGRGRTPRAPRGAAGAGGRPPDARRARRRRRRAARRRRKSPARWRAAGRRRAAMRPPTRRSRARPGRARWRSTSSW